MNQVQLDKIKIGLSQVISEELLGSSIDIEREIIGQVRFNMKGFLYGENKGTRQIKYPANWKQAIKDRFAPEWFKRHWPVVYIVHDISYSVIYPDFKPKLENHKYTWMIGESVTRSKA